ncbi:MAG: 3'-5' exonuclease [Angelakisella sp.]
MLYHKAADEQREAHFIASTIRKNHEKGAKYSDHAILYRMNALSSTLEQMFIRQGIPYRIIGGLKFFDRKEVKDILAYLAVLNNPDDSLRLRRIINEPKRGIGEATMNTAQQVAESLGQSLYRTLQTAEEYAPLSGKSRALMEFTAMMDGIAESVDEVPSSKRWSRCWTKAAM